MVIKMELYYVVELQNNGAADDEGNQRATLIAGPFGNWDQAFDAKKKAEDHYLISRDFDILTKIIEFDQS